MFARRMIATRVEALVIARAQASARPPRVAALLAALAPYAPPALAAAAWRDRLEGAVAELRARGTLDGELRVARGALAAAIGRRAATWPELATRVLPGLALDIAAGDHRIHARLAGRDAWAAAIAGRALALWTAGPPPSPAALCDALAWRALGLAGKPRPCPPEIRAHFVQRALAGATRAPAHDAAPPERLVRLYAASVVGAPRPDLAALHAALVRRWCAGGVIGAVTAAGATRTAGTTRPAGTRPAARATASFAATVRDVARGATAGVFGTRKVFIAAVWRELGDRPPWGALTLADFKARLVAAHRAGDVALARADHVAASDPELVAASETVTDGASFHFIVREAP